MCGRVSGLMSSSDFSKLLSPLTWRCFVRWHELWGFAQSIFSSVEVFLSRGALFTLKKSRLHACGGVSGRLIFDADFVKSSPPMWRCFYLCGWHAVGYDIISMSVEVFLKMVLNFLILIAVSMNVDVFL